MSLLRPLRIGRSLPLAASLDTRPDWQQADPNWIHAALEHARVLPSGGWYVAGASAEFGQRPRRVQIEGRALVVWRNGERLLAGPEECPHMGASLCEGRVERGRLICPWHGLALGPEAHGRWAPLTSHDDGVLFWVRLPSTAEPVSPAPYLPQRPKRPFLDATIHVEAACEVRDVLQNRLDPWHGVHFHPHSFATLRVLERSPSAITVRVAYRITKRIGIEVDARFDCPDPRTIAMTIIAGDGEGSVVETHATPIAPGRTAIIEATFASSDRPGFALACRAARVLRPLIAARAARLWREDAAYAERLHALRMQAQPAAHRARVPAPSEASSVGETSR